MIRKLEKPNKFFNFISEARKNILGLPEKWDGYNASPINKDVFARSRKILAEIFNEWNNKNIKLPLPSIQAVPDGSIDLNWETDEFELLVNIPSKFEDGVSFYGEVFKRPDLEIEVKATIDVSNIIISWFRNIYE